MGVQGCKAHTLGYTFHHVLDLRSIIFFFIRIANRTANRRVLEHKVVIASSMHSVEVHMKESAPKRYRVVLYICCSFSIKIVWSVCVTSSLLQKMRPDAPFIFDVVYVLHLNKSP